MINILVIDDDRAMANFLSDFLSSRNYQVNVFGNGEEALKFFKKHKSDIVLLDIRLPGMLGSEVLQTIKKINPQTKVVMMTGVRNEDIVEKFKNLGASAYITKPFSLNYLERTLLPKLRNES